MSIMQQSSKAQDRTLGVWFHNIEQGMVKLPRFQRFEAWDRGRVASFLVEWNNPALDGLWSAHLLKSAEEATVAA